MSFNLDHSAVEAVAREARRDALEKGQDDLVKMSKETVHVITGKLRDSIHAGEIDEEAHSAEVIADTDYAIYEHEGTRYRGPHPFFSEAIDRLTAGN